MDAKKNASIGGGYQSAKVFRQYDPDNNTIVDRAFLVKEKGAKAHLKRNAGSYAGTLAGAAAGIVAGNKVLKAGGSSRKLNWKGKTAAGVLGARVGIGVGDWLDKGAAQSRLAKELERRKKIEGMGFLPEYDRDPRFAGRSNYSPKSGDFRALSARDVLTEFAGGYVNTEEGVKRERGFVPHLSRNAGKYIGSIGGIIGLPIGWYVDRKRKKRDVGETKREGKVPWRAKGAPVELSARDVLTEFRILGVGNKNYHRPAIVSARNIPSGMAAYGTPETVMANPNDPLVQSAGKRGAKGGVVLESHWMNDIAAPDYMPKLAGYKDQNQMKAALRRHEIVHGIQSSKRGYKDISRIRDLVKDEIGAYSTMNRRLKGGSKILRALNGVGGVGLSTAVGTALSPKLRKRAGLRLAQAGGLAGLGYGAKKLHESRKNKNELSARDVLTEFAGGWKDENRYGILPDGTLVATPVKEKGVAAHLKRNAGKYLGLAGGLAAGTGMARVGENAGFIPAGVFGGMVVGKSVDQYRGSRQVHQVLNNMKNKKQELSARDVLTEFAGGRERDDMGRFQADETGGVDPLSMRQAYAPGMAGAALGTGVALGSPAGRGVLRAGKKNALRFMNPALRKLGQRI